MFKKTIKLFLIFSLFLTFNVYSESDKENFIEKEYSNINNFIEDNESLFNEITFTQINNIEIPLESPNQNNLDTLKSKIEDIKQYYNYAELMFKSTDQNNNIFKKILSHDVKFNKKDLVEQNKTEILINKESNFIDKIVINNEDFKNNHFIKSDSYIINYNDKELFAVKKNSGSLIYINKTGVYHIYSKDKYNSSNKLITPITEQNKNSSIKTTYKNIFSFFDDVISGKINSINITDNYLKTNDKELIISNYVVSLPDIVGDFLIGDTSLFISDDSLYFIKGNKVFLSLDMFIPNVKTISYSDMIEKIKNNELLYLKYTTKINKQNNQTDLIVLFLDKKGQYYNSTLLSDNDNNFLNQLLLEHNVKTLNVIKNIKENITFGDKIYYLLVGFSLILICYSCFNIKFDTILNLFKENNNTNLSNIDFDDIAGHQEAKRDIQEVIDIIKNKHKYEEMGVNQIKGILLYGPPGNGKTMFAKAVAKSCGAKFFSVSGSEMVEVYVGTGAKRIRSLFNKAKKSKQAIIFIDEIDAVGQKRLADSTGGNQEYNQTINQLLTSMDGFNSHKYNILIIGATNRIEALDEALLRPGRFDRQIYIGKPSFNGRKEIIKVYFNKYKEKNNLSDDDYEKIAGLTIDFSGADLSNLVNEAKIIAVKNNSKIITLEYILQARNKILIGNPRADIKLLDEELKRIAYHEVGHTIMILNRSKNNVEHVSITPYGKALGITLQTPNKDNYNYTKKELLNEIYSLLGGRASEEVFLNEISAGASNDLERVYVIMFALITNYGMSDIIFKNMGITTENYQQLSEQTKFNIEQEIEKQIEIIYSEILSFLNNNKQLVEEMVAELIKKHSLNKNEILQIWEKYK